MQAHVLDPLGMSETRPVPSADDPLLASGYTREKEGYQREAFPFWVMKGFEASANFASSVNDLVKYAAFHLGLSGADALSPYSLDRHAPRPLAGRDLEGRLRLGHGDEQDQGTGKSAGMVAAIPAT